MGRRRETKAIRSSCYHVRQMKIAHPYDFLIEDKLYIYILSPNVLSHFIQYNSPFSG